MTKKMIDDLLDRNIFRESSDPTIQLCSFFQIFCDKFYPNVSKVAFQLEYVSS